MENGLSLYVLGSPVLQINQRPLNANTLSSKGQALLIYLAVTGRFHSRTALAGLLWGDMPEDNARANLRLTLSKLHKLLPEGILFATRLEVGLANFWLDAVEFEKGLESGERLSKQTPSVTLHSFLNLYRADFLDDFPLSNAPDFEEWATNQRERLRQTAVSKLSQWLDTAVSDNNHEDGIVIARKLLTIEPWHEQSHRQLMRLLAFSGQRNAALAQYESCRRLLTAELGIEPTAETFTLFEQIKNDQVTGWQGGKVKADHRDTVSPHHNLPAQLTAFIGRKAELDRLSAQLLDSGCRLLTIMGIGGMGKTRLALAAAAQVAPHFADGITFVDLAPLADADLLVTAVTDALALTLNSNTSPKTQLAQYVTPRHMLLLLDNFETVLEGAEMLADLLTQAPRLSILVTSREPLNLHGEWLYPLRGLAPPNETVDDIALYADALTFFAGCARRVVPEFSVQGEIADVIELCQLTEGMPLALELAASWVKSLTVAEIVLEIRQNLDILNGRQTNRPERQRSIQAVLNQTWQRIGAAEQDTFARLALFHGTFDRQAAQQVAGANLGTLTNLLDKALLQRRQPHEYMLHPLVRQFAYGRLQANPTLFSQTQRAYAATYADFCHDCLPRLLQRDRTSLAELKQKQDNIRAVWEWAVAQHEVSILDKMARPFALYLTHYSYNGELYQRFTTAVSTLTSLPDPAARRVLAYVLLEMGNVQLTLGKMDDADSALHHSETIYTELNIPHAPGLGTDPSAIRSIVAWMRSDFATAVRLGERALHHARAEQNPRNEAYAHFVLSGANIALGHYQVAQTHAQQAFALAQAEGDRWFLAYCHIELGKSALALGDTTHADHHFETAFSLRQEMDNPTGMAMARLMLGESQRRQQKWTAAEHAFAEARQIYQESQNRMGLARAVAGLADAATAQKQWAQARALYVQGLNLVLASGLHTYANTVLVGVGEWLWAIGQRERAVEVLTAVAQDPLVNVDLKERALVWLTAVPLPPQPTATNTFQLAESLVHELELNSPPNSE